MIEKASLAVEGGPGPDVQAPILGRLLVYAPTTLIRILVRFAALYLFTRLLSPSEYGVYTLILSGVALAQTLLFLWIEAAAFRFVMRADARGWLPDLSATLARLSVLVIAASVLALAGVAVALLVAGHVAVVRAIMAGLALATLGFLTNLRREVLRAGSRTGRYALLDASAKIGGLALGVAIVIFADWGGLGPIAGACLALTLILLADTMSWKRRPAPGRYRRRVAGLALRYGAGLAVAQGAAILLATGDRFVIAAMLGTDAAGAYGAGYGLAAQLVGFIFAGISLAATPLTLRTLEARGEADSRAVASAYIRVLIFLAVPAAAGLTLVAAPLAHFAIGEELATASVIVIQWIAPASVLAGLVSNYAELPFMLKRRTGQFALILGLAALANIALNIALIPVAGIVGAIIATNLCYGIALIAALVVGSKLFPLPLPIGALLTNGLNTAVMVAAVLIVKSRIAVSDGADFMTLLILTAVGTITYAIASLTVDQLSFLARKSATP